MVIDNTALIRSLLVFPEKKPSEDKISDELCLAQKKAHVKDPSQAIEMRDCFYVVQLLQRQKDNPDQQFMNPNFRNNSNRTIQQFQIYSLEDWDLKIPTIIKLARIYQCRVYIDLNLRDSRDVFGKMMSNMASRFSTSNFTKLHRLYNEAVGETSTMRGQRKTWVVDVDTHDRDKIEEIKKFIAWLPGGGWSKSKILIKRKDKIIETQGAEVLTEVPTKNGVHLITSSFDMKEFKAKFPDVDVLDHNPTIAWMETDWSTSREKL